MVNKPLGTILLLVFLCGCPYRVSARLPFASSRLCIIPFENRTTDIFLGQELTRMLKKEILQRSGCRIVSSSNKADSIRGIIRSTGRDVISEDSAGNVLSERITINVEIKLSLLNGPDREFSVIGVAVHEKQNLVSRGLLLREALRDASHRIVNTLIEKEVP